MRSWLRALLAIAVPAVLVLSCTDADDPVAPERSVRVQLAPRYAPAASSIASDPITAIRLTATSASTGTVLQVETFVASEVETPDGGGWEISLEVTVPPDGSPVTILVELVDASGQTEWSGRTDPIPVSGGSSSVVEDVQVFPGPPANLSVEGVEITSTLPSLLEGDTARLAASLAGGGEGARVVWSSLTGEVASVDEEGLVTALLPGAARIQAAAGPAADTLELEVRAAVASVVVSPATDTLGILGDTARFTAEALGADGSVLEGRSFTWSSSDELVAIVDQSGLATAVGNGTVLIEATSEGVTGSGELTVQAPAIPSGFTRLWLGGDPSAPTSWGAERNWNPIGVPTATDTVLIEATAPDQPVLDASHAVGGLTVETGATLDLGAFTLTASGSVSAGRTIVGSGTLIMTGGGATLSGTVPNLLVQGDVTLTGATTVGGTVAIDGSAATLTAGGQTLTVGDSLHVHDDGLLVMTDPADTVRVAAGARFEGRSSAGSLTAGQLEVGGAFTQLATWSAEAFAAGGAHRTLLDGTAAQPVSFASTNSGFHDLEIVNTAGVSFPATTSASGTLLLGPGAVVTAGDYRTTGGVSTGATSSLTLSRLHVGGTMAVQGVYSVTTTGFTGSAGQIVPTGLPYQNVEVSGEAVLGGAVDVSGLLSVQQPAGTLTVGGQTLTVGGRLHVHDEGLLVMTDPADVVRVAGEARFEGRSGAGSLTAGQLEVAGDLTQLDTWSAEAFAASGAHRTLLDGAAAQVVSLASAASGFHDLEIVNTVGVDVTGTAHVGGDLTVADGAILDSGTGTLIVAGEVFSGLSSVVTLQALELSDDTMSIGGSYSVATTVFAAAPDVLNPQILQSGLPYQDVVVRSVARYPDTCGGTETISGTLTASGSGAVFVPGPYLALTVQGDLVTELGGIIEMVPPLLVLDCASGSLTVNGNATFGGGSTDGHLTARTLTVAGDFTETATDAFRAGGSHTTVLSGTGTVSFADAQSSHFHHLTLSGTTTVPGTTWVGGNLLLSGTGSATGAGGLRALGDVTTEAATTLGVSLVAVGGTLNVQGTYSVPTIVFTGGTSDVDRQVIQADLPYEHVVIQGFARFPDFGPSPQSLSGNLVVQGSGDFRPGACVDVSVGGDLHTQETGTLTMGFDVECVDDITVAGDAVFAGGSTAETLTDGVLGVAGSFTQTGGSSTTSFAPTDGGFHRVVLNGTGTQTISFENPGTTTSHFLDLEITNTTGPLTLLSDVHVTGTLTEGVGGSPTVTGSGQVLEMGDAGIDGLTFDNVLLRIIGPAAATPLANVAFSANYAVSATQLYVEGPNGSFTFDALTFNTVPTGGGFYIHAHDTVADQSSFTIDVLRSVPATGAPHVNTTGVAEAAVVNW